MSDWKYSGSTAGDWTSLKYYYPNGHYLEQGYYNKPEEPISVNTEDHNHNKIIDLYRQVLS